MKMNYILNYKLNDLLIQTYKNDSSCIKLLIIYLFTIFKVFSMNLYLNKIKFSYLLL